MGDIDVGRVKVTAVVEDQTKSGVKDVEKRMKELQESINETKEAISGLQEELGDAFQAGDNEAMVELQGAIGATNREIAAMEREMASLAQAHEQSKTAAEGASEGQASFRQRLKEAKQELYALEEAGDFTSEAYRKLGTEVAKMEDTMADANAMTKHLASDTMVLDEVLSTAGAASGAFSVGASAMSLLGIESEKAAEVQTKLQTAIAMTTGIQQLQNALQHQSAMMLGITRVQTMMLTKAEALNTAAKSKNIIVSKAATVAQAIFNKVAMANPYVLLAMALITVVGALIAFAAASDSAAEKQKMANELEAAHLNYLEKISALKKQMADEAVNDAQRELDQAKARGASSMEIYELEDKIYEIKQKAARKQVTDNSIMVSSIQSYRDELKELYKILEDIEEMKAKGTSKVRLDIDKDGKIDKVDIEEAIENIQAQIDNTEKKVQIGVQAKENLAQVEADRQKQLAQRKKDAAQTAKETAKIQRQEVRAAEDARLALIQDSYIRERLIENENWDRKKKDLQRRLKEESNLTTAARKAINQQIEYAEQQHQKNLEKIKFEHENKVIDLRRQIEDAQVASSEQTAEEQREALSREYRRQIEDIQRQLSNPEGNLSNKEFELLKQKRLEFVKRYKTEAEILEQQLAAREIDIQKDVIESKLAVAKNGSAEQLQLRLDMIEKERQAELAANKQKAKDAQMDESLINAKYDAQANNEVLGFAREFGEYARLFDDIGTKSKKQLNEAIKKVKQIIQIVKGEKEYTEDIGISKETIDALKQAPEEMTALYQQMIDMQEKFNEQADYPFSSLIQGFKDLNTWAELAASAEAEADEQLKRMKQEQSKAFQTRALKNIADAANEAGQYIADMAMMMRDFAETVGDDDMVRAADTLEKVGTVMGGISAGASAGSAFGGWGALIGAILGAVKELTGIFIGMKAEEIAATNAMKEATMDYATSIALVNTQLKDIYDNGYGERAFSKIADAADNAREALNSYQTSQAVAAAEIYEKWNLIVKRMPTGKIYETNLFSEEYIKGLEDLANGGFKASAEYILGRAIVKGSNIAVRDIAPDLFDENGMINIDIAEAFLDTYGALLDESFAKQIQGLIDLKKAYEENLDAIKSELIDTFGYLGDEAMNSLIDGITDGTNAWKSFKDSGVKALEDIAEKMIYDTYLSAKFSELQKQLEDAVDPTKSQEEQAEKYAEILDGWMDGMETSMNQAQAAAEAFKGKMKSEYGLNLWEDATGSNSIGSAVKNITEESASIIAGHLNANRIMLDSINGMMAQAIRSLQTIATNSGYLKSIDNRLSALANDYENRIQ